MKASLVRNPFLGPGARLALHPQRDTPAGLVRLAVDDCAPAASWCCSPKARTTKWPLEPFRPGFAHRQARRRADPDRLHRHRLALPRQGLACSAAAAADRVLVAPGPPLEPTDDPVALLAEIETYLGPACARRPEASMTPSPPTWY